MTQHNLDNSCLSLPSCLLVASSALSPQSLVRVIPLTDPLGPAVMTLLLDDCPLPTSSTAVRCLELIDRLDVPGDQPELVRPVLHRTYCTSTAQRVTKHRNMAIVLGCIAEKLAGPRSVALLTEQVQPRSYCDFLQCCRLGPGLPAGQPGVHHRPARHTVQVAVHP